MLTVSYDDKLRLFDTSKLEGELRGKETRHNNQTGRWLTPFKVINVLVKSRSWQSTHKSCLIYYVIPENLIWSKMWKISSLSWLEMCLIISTNVFWGKKCNSQMKINSLTELTMVIGYLIFIIRCCCRSERICEELIFKGEKSSFFKLSES